MREELPEEVMVYLNLLFRDKDLARGYLQDRPEIRRFIPGMEALVEDKPELSSGFNDNLRRRCELEMAK